MRSFKKRSGIFLLLCASSISYVNWPLLSKLKIEASRSEASIEKNPTLVRIKRKNQDEIQFQDQLEIEQEGLILNTVYENTNDYINFQLLESDSDIVQTTNDLDEHKLSRPEIQAQIRKLFNPLSFSEHGRPACTKVSNIQPLKGNSTIASIPTSFDADTAPMFTDIANRNPTLRTGGSFWVCEENQNSTKVAVIIPFRDRWTHLKYLLEHLHPILQRQKLNYQVFVIEQDGRDTFNKGRLFNAGFMVVDALKRFDCIIFQDVDLLLEDDRLRYDCNIELEHNSNQTTDKASYVKHLATYVDSFNYEIQEYKRPVNGDFLTINWKKMPLYGGVTAMKSTQYKQINGYSNEYWGWGCEDEDLAYRLTNNKASLKIQEAQVKAGFTMIRHKRDPGNFDNLGRFYKLKDAVVRQYRDGISNLKFSVREIDEQPTFTHLVVNIGGTKFGRRMERASANLLPSNSYQNQVRNAQKMDQIGVVAHTELTSSDEIYKLIVTSCIVSAIVVTMLVTISLILTKYDRYFTTPYLTKTKNELMARFKITQPIPKRERKYSVNHQRHLSLPRNMKLSQFTKETMLDWR